MREKVRAEEGRRGGGVGPEATPLAEHVTHSGLTFGAPLVIRRQLEIENNP